MIPAVKHMDMVLGVDTHIVAVPTPAGPVPTPLPNPFIGMVFDIMEYMPLVGATIRVNKQIRAIAGTSGKASPPHLPLGGPFIKPPANECEMFMGSATVVMDGDAATFTGLPVLSCQDIGMIAPFRTNPKKRSRILSLVLPTSNVIGIPSGNPVLIGGPPTIMTTGLPGRIGTKLGGGALKKLCSTKAIRKKIAHAQKEFKALKQKVFKNMKPSALKCDILEAEPVNTVTGAVVVDQQDFSLQWRIPLTWNRHYDSTETRKGLCGRGWQTVADSRLSIEEDGTVLYHDGGAGATVFERLPTNAEPVKSIVDGTELSYESEGYRVKTKEGLIYSFSRKRYGQRELPLEKITDASENWIAFHREVNTLIQIRSSDGQRIEVVSVNGQITRLILHHPQSLQPRQLVGYAYTGGTDLSVVYDQHGVGYSFEYSKGLLTKHTDRNGLSFYYQYDLIDDSHKCVHAWGDGKLYDYHFKYYPTIYQTQITDSLSNTSVIRYTKDNQVLSKTDALGAQTRFEYDESCRCTAVIDPSGKATEYHYDALGNVVRVKRADGKEIVTTYDKNSHIESITDPNGNTWRMEWNQQSLLSRQISPLGHSTEYHYSPVGDLHTVVNAKGVASYVKSDIFGNTIALVDASGAEMQYTYDLFGNITSQTDPSGVQTLYIYDAKSRLIKVKYASGSEICCEYDREDNLRRFIDEEGRITELEYTGIGEVKRRINPDGTAVEFRYDTEERLIELINERGRRYQLKRDAVGRIIEEIDYWNQSRTYDYDTSGNLTEVKDQKENNTKLIYDEVGRIKTKLYSDGLFEVYEYDANGNLLKTQNKAITIERQYDKENKLIHEKQGKEFSVSYTYDETGNRTERKSSTGTVVEYAYDKTDTISSIAVNGEPVVSIQRDTKTKTVQERLYKQLVRNFEYDLNGRVTQQSLKFNQKDLVSRIYEYDRTGNLTRLKDSRKGVTSFHYDPMGRLIQHTNPEKRIREFIYDTTGNLLKELEEQTQAQQPSVNDSILLKEGKQSELKVPYQRTATYENTTYIYDAVGNLVQRKTGADSTNFTWNVAGNLVKAEVYTSGTSTSNGSDTNSQFKKAPVPVITEFGYDSQSRRCFKETKNIRTEFYWDGEQLLAEKVTSAKNFREYIYYPNSFEPLAVVDSDQRVLYFNNDQVGLPQEIVNTEGKIFWSASFGPFGAVEKYDTAIIENPIRFQGQYYDAEIDLCYNRYRYYDQKIGQFVSQDPLGLQVGSNLYKYAPNVSCWIDPLGLKCKNSWNDFQQKSKGAFKNKKDTATAYKLWKNQDWANLEKSIGSNKWPPNRGFVNSKETILLPGDQIDRYGGRFTHNKFEDMGSFVAPAGIPFTDRALPKSSINKPYKKYEVLQPIKVEEGPAIPWFGEKGGGKQYELLEGENISTLLKKGKIKEI